MKVTVATSMKSGDELELRGLAMRVARVSMRRVAYVDEPPNTNGTPAAHIGQAVGTQSWLGIFESDSRGRSWVATKLAPVSPRTISAPTTIGKAPQAFKALSVPRTSVPALIASSTTAIRRLRIADCEESGR